MANEYIDNPNLTSFENKKHLHFKNFKKHVSATNRRLANILTVSTRTVTRLRKKYQLLANQEIESLLISYGNKEKLRKTQFSQEFWEYLEFCAFGKI